MPRITELYAFLAEEAPGEEGVMAFWTGETWMPMIGADMTRVESLLPLAEAISRATGKPSRVRRFVLREDA
jgi:hypothetical protein